MIGLVRQEFEGSNAEAEFNQSLEGESANQYQKAFTLLHKRKGPDVANRIVRTAVWQALDANAWPPHIPKKSPQDADPTTCQALENEVKAWVLPQAVDILGQLLAAQPNPLSKTVLTTNFDPLIEVSVLKHGGQFHRTATSRDVNPDQTGGVGTHIVHLHGYWFGPDTLHVPQQLLGSRPELSDWLKRVVNKSTLVVLGYGGWGDVITQALTELLPLSASTPDILWAFHEEDTAKIEASNQPLLALLEPGINWKKVTLYQGIDCRSLLNEIHQKLRLSDPAASGPTGGPPVIPVTRDDSEVCDALRLGAGTLPPYVNWDSARQLAQAGLVGKWDGANEADRAAIGGLLGKDYREWTETLRADMVRPDTPLIQRDEKWRVVARGEAWSALGNRITDEDLERFQKLAVTVLGERDPQFELPKEQRLTASVYGKQSKYSARLRAGLAETLALLGSKSEALSSCSQGKAEATARLAVRELLKDASWECWASLNPHLPLLAEAAPDKFLDAVEAALVNLDQTPFREIFSQEGGTVIGGGNYLTGLLWGLETLAWSPEHLARVAVILADLASIDPGGNWRNRPANSLADIFLPWHVQTTASFEKRQAALKTVLKEQSAVGWQLLLGLRPHSHATTTGCRQPTWRDYIPKDWKDEVSQTEYREQITAYTELLVGLAKESAEKLDELIRHLPDLPRPAYDSLLNYLRSQEIVNLPESERLPLWESLDKIVRQHRKAAAADAQWALPEQALLKIEETANALAPQAPELKYQRLFSNQDFDLFEGRGNYDEQRERLDRERQVAVQTILTGGRLKDVLVFAQNVAAPYQVGRALGVIASDELEAEILPTLLDTTEETEKQVAAGFVWVRYRAFEWTWVDGVLQREWTKAQQATFLEFLPFEEEVWRRVADQLGEQDEGQYWRNVMVIPYGADRDLTTAIEKLLVYHRAGEAVRCVSRTADDDSRFDESLATRALLAVLEEPPDIERLDRHETVEVITRLQKSPTADRDALFNIEWNFLPWLDQFSPGSPSTLEQRLASDPAFFAEVVGLVYRSTKDEQDDDQPDAHRENLAQNAYGLLTDWCWCPGKLPDGSFDVDAFREWLSEARRLTEETGHWDIAQIQIGKVLTHAPSDPNGLWIHEGIAEALNRRDTEEMRSGFTTALFNQRGVHDFTAGKEEREFAQQYRTKADALEDQRFSRFATAMRGLANEYEQDAKRAARLNESRV